MSPGQLVPWPALKHVWLIWSDVGCLLPFLQAPSSCGSGRSKDVNLDFSYNPYCPWGCVLILFSCLVANLLILFVNVLNIGLHLIYSNLITKFRQHQIEHEVLDNGFNRQNQHLCFFCILHMYVWFFSEFSMSEFWTLKEMFMSWRMTFRPTVRKFILERKCSKLFIPSPFITSVVLLFIPPAFSLWCFWLFSIIKLNLQQLFSVGKCCFCFRSKKLLSPDSHPPITWIDLATDTSLLRTEVFLVGEESWIQQYCCNVTLCLSLHNTTLSEWNQVSPRQRERAWCSGGQ